MNELEVPQALAGPRIQRNKGVGEQILAVPVPAVEVGACGFRGGVYDAPLHIHCDAGPVRGAPRVFQIAFRPGLRPEFPRTGQSMEDPDAFAGPRVERNDRPGHVLRYPYAENKHVFKDISARVQAHVRTAFPVDAVAYMEPAAFAERGDRLARLCVEGVQPGAFRREDAPVFSVFPVYEASLTAAALVHAAVVGIGFVGIEGPQMFARCGVERRHFAGRGSRVQHAVHDEVVGLVLALFSRIVTPRHFQQVDILCVDLVEQGILVAARMAEIIRPVRTGADRRARGRLGAGGQSCGKRRSDGQAGEKAGHIVRR